MLGHPVQERLVIGEHPLAPQFAERLHRAVRQALRRIGNDQSGIEHVLLSQPEAHRACAPWRVEREMLGRRRFKGLPGPTGHHLRRVKGFAPRLRRRPGFLVQHQQASLAPAQRRLHRVRQTRTDSLGHDEAIHHHLDRVPRLRIQPHRLVCDQFHHLAIHAGPYESLPGQPLQHVPELPALVVHDRPQQHHLRAHRQSQDPVHDLGRGLGTHRLAGLRIMRLPQRGVQQPQVIVDLRRRRDRGPRIRPAGPLFDGDRGGQTFDVFHVRLLHLVEELPGVGRQRLHVLALPLREQGIERQ